MRIGESNPVGLSSEVAPLATVTPLVPLKLAFTATGCRR